MPLQQADIRFARSAVMADVPEGGGAPTSQLIPDGASNTIYPDVSEETRTTGRVEIRQVHTVLRNQDVAPLLGSNVIVAAPPNDSNVDITLLSTKNPFATRTDITKAIEGSMVPSVEFNGYLLEDQGVNQRSIQLFQRPNSEPPGIGLVYVLIYQEGLPTERRQRVRIKAVDTKQRTFSYSNGGQIVDYQAQVVTAELFEPLRFDFPGSPPSRLFSRDTTKTRVRETVYADAGMFYGAAKLAQAAALADSELLLDTVYSRLVPNSRTEAISIDQRPASDRTVTLATQPITVTVGVTPHTQRVKITVANVGLSYVFQLRPLPAPGTIVIHYWSMGQRYTVSDDGQGRLTGAGSGLLNYSSGVVPLTLQALPDVGTMVTIAWGENTGYTDRSGQGAQVRAPEYSFQLPQTGYVRGSLVITWTSGGVLKTASANVAGIISGDAAGSIDAPSGLVFLQPAAMIDAGGQFALAYSTVDVVEETLSVPSLDAGGFATLNLAQQPAAGTLQVTWNTSQEVSNTSGGSVNAASVNKTANSFTFFAPYYTFAGGAGTTYSKTSTGGNTSTTSSTQDGSNRVITTHTAADDGAGNMVGSLGTVNYSGKSVNLRFVALGKSASAYKSDYQNAAEFEQAVTGGTPGGSGSGSQTSMQGGEYSTTAVTEEVLAASTVTVRYIVGSPAPTAQNATVTPPPVYIDLCPYTSDAIVPGSVQFAWMGRTYTDIDGTLYRSGGTGTKASGTIDYAAGLALMTDWVVGANPKTVTLQSLWTRRGQWTTASLFFDTTAAPLRAGAGGFVLSVVDTAGNVLTANVDAQGNITGSHMTGKVQFATGSVELQFGDLVDDATLTAAQKAEWWYQAADVGAVDPGKIWRPWPVDPTTLRYSIVSFIYLPIDSELLGLDPTALPADGRVAVFRPGDLLVAAKTIEGVAFAPSNAQVYDVGTPRLSLVRVLDAATKEAIADGWSVDLDAGKVTFIDVSAMPAQVEVYARQEVYRRIAEVRIDGTVRLTLPLGIDLGVGAVISSALRQGDLFARVSRTYGQKTWDGVNWVDGLSGDASVGKYDAVNFPITVANIGAITERWALRLRSDATTFDLIGQHFGQVASGTINANFAPINPASGQPYMTVKAAGWGSGWVAGNTLFIDTVGASFPVDVIRSIQPGTPPGGDYSFLLEQRGDVDKLPAGPFE